MAAVRLKDQKEEADAALQKLQDLLHEVFEELLRIRVIAVLGYWFGRNNDGELARCRRTILLKVN
jgi:hypothetical protein